MIEAASPTLRSSWHLIHCPVAHWGPIQRRLLPTRILDSFQSAPQIPALFLLYMYIYLYIYSTLSSSYTCFLFCRFVRVGKISHPLLGHFSDNSNSFSFHSNQSTYCLTMLVQCVYVHILFLLIVFTVQNTIGAV